MQKRKQAMIESFINVATGMVFAYLTMQFILAPLLDIPLTAQTNLVITAVLTIIAVVRNYAVRRIFNHLEYKANMKRKNYSSKQEHWQPEFDDMVKVLAFGAKKHGSCNWLTPNGSKSSTKDMHASIFRHVAQSSAGLKKDHETSLHPLLHAAVRCLMVYTREKRGLTHIDDNGAKHDKINR